MIGIIGKKLGMTQIFNEQGQQIPCTVVEAAPNPVTKVMSKADAGFDSVELGYGAQRLARENKKNEHTPRGRRANKAEVGHAKKAGLEAPPQVLHSFRIDDAQGKGAEVPTYNCWRHHLGGHLRTRRTRQGYWHDEGSWFPGRRQALGLSRRTKHAR